MCFWLQYHLNKPLYYLLCIYNVLEHILIFVTFLYNVFYSFLPSGYKSIETPMIQLLELVCAYLLQNLKKNSNSEIFSIDTLINRKILSLFLYYHFKMQTFILTLLNAGLYQTCRDTYYLTILSFVLMQKSHYFFLNKRNVITQMNYK